MEILSTRNSLRAGLRNPDSGVFTRPSRKPHVAQASRLCPEGLPHRRWAAVKGALAAVGTTGGRGIDLELHLTGGEDVFQAFDQRGTGRDAVLAIRVGDDGLAALELEVEPDFQLAGMFEQEIADRRQRLVGDLDFGELNTKQFGLT